MAAALALRTVWLAAAADPSDVVSIPFVTRIDPTPQTQGEFRQYGQNRFRLAMTAATQETFQLAFNACDQALTSWLRNHDGQDLWYRDDWGEKLHGAYLGPQITRHPYDKNADVTLTFSETTATEAV